MTSSDIKSLFQDELQNGVICNYPSLKQVDELLMLISDGRTRVLMCSTYSLPKLFIHNPRLIDENCKVNKKFAISASTFLQLESSL